MKANDSPLRPTSGERVAKGAAIFANLVPLVGGVLSGTANEVIARRQNRRLDAFLAYIAKDLDRLRDRVNAEFVRTEEFNDLAEHAFTAAADTRQAEKLDAIRAVFLHTVTSTSPSYDEAAEVLDLLGRWQARHVVLLRILADPRGTDERAGSPVGRGGGISTSIDTILMKLLPGWSEEQIDRTWDELHDARIHRTAGTKAMMTDRGIHQLEGRLTEFGELVVRYLIHPVLLTS